MMNVQGGWYLPYLAAAQQQQLTGTAASPCGQGGLTAAAMPTMVTAHAQVPQQQQQQQQQPHIHAQQQQQYAQPQHQQQAQLPQQYAAATGKYLLNSANNNNNNTLASGPQQQAFGVGGLQQQQQQAAFQQQQPAQPQPGMTTAAGLQGLPMGLNPQYAAAALNYQQAAANLAALTGMHPSALLAAAASTPNALAATLGQVQPQPPPQGQLLAGPPAARPNPAPQLLGAGPAATGANAVLPLYGKLPLLKTPNLAAKVGRNFRFVSCRTPFHLKKYSG